MFSAEIIKNLNNNAHVSSLGDEPQTSANGNRLICRELIRPDLQMFNDEPKEVANRNSADSEGFEIPSDGSIT